MYNARKAWVVTFLLFIGQMINYFDKSVIGLAAIPIMRELKLTPEQYGLIASSFFSLYAVSGVLVGLFLAHRVSSKALLTVLVLIWSLSQLPVVFSGSLTTLVACRVVLGVGEGPASPSAINACHEWFTSDQRNMPSALVMLGVSLGSLIAGPILSYTIIGYGWRAAFLLCSALGLAWVLLWRGFGADGPGSIRSDIGITESRAVAGLKSTASAWAILFDPTIIGTILVGFTAYWMTGFTVPWLAPLIRSGLGYDAATTGWIVAAVAGTNSALLLAISYASQRMLERGIPSVLARGKVNALCMLGGAVALFGAATFASPVLKLVLVAIGGALPTLSFTLCPALISEIVPTPQRRRFLITISASITIAGFVSPLVAGRLIGSAPGIAGYEHALLVNALVLAAGGLAGMWLLRPDKSILRFASLQAAAG